MTGEFFFEDETQEIADDPMRAIAKYFFFAGLGIVGRVLSVRAARAARKRTNGA